MIVCLPAVSPGAGGEWAHHWRWRWCKYLYGGTPPTCGALAGATLVLLLLIKITLVNQKEYSGKSGSVFSVCKVTTGPGERILLRLRISLPPPCLSRLHEPQHARGDPQQAGGPPGLWQGPQLSRRSAGQPHPPLQTVGWHLVLTSHFVWRQIQGFHTILTDISFSSCLHGNSVANKLSNPNSGYWRLRQITI